MEPVVERVVGEVLDRHAAQLRAEIVRRVMEEVAAGGAPEAASGTSARDLARAVADIHQGASQREILRALLDSCSRVAARVALFVVKGNLPTGWQGRGFAHDDMVKDFAVDKNAPAFLRAIAERTVLTAPLADLDPRFLREMGAPAAGSARLLPLILKEKVAALIYADSGNHATGHLDEGALDLLVLATGAWLEVNALRKSAGKDAPSTNGEAHPVEANQEARDAVAAAAAPSVSVPAPPPYNDPFAAHAPGSAMAAAASGAVSLSPPLSAPPHVASPVPSAPPPSAPAQSPEDSETHTKAQRFARLLVDEIKLYHQVQVAEGRKNHDLYDRLKEVIDKSRVTYQKRYGSTAAAAGNYFQHEIIRSLAEDNPAILGANFRQ